MNVWFCPNGKRFMREIKDALADGRPCLAVIPDGEEPLVFSSEISEYLSKHFGAHPKSILIDESLGFEEGLAGAVLPDDEGEGGDPRPAIEAMVEGPEGGPSNSLVIAVFTAGTPKEMERPNIEALARARTAMRKFRDSGGCQKWKLLAVVPSSIRLSACDPGVDIHEWWNRLRPSDLEYSIELALGKGKRERWEEVWLYGLCRGLAALDPMLAEPLISKAPKNLAGVLSVLKKHKLASLPERVINAVRRMADGKLQVSSAAVPRREDAAPLWEAGVLGVNCYGDVSIHPAALVAAGYEDRVEQIVVSGQMRVFLPLVQEVHAQICRYMDSRYRTWRRDIDTIKGADTEIGPLHSYLLEQARTYAPQEILDIASVFRSIRNKVAHGSFLDWTETKNGLKRYFSFFKK